MLSFVKEASLWETLQSATLPIVVYGMGDGAQKIIDVCNRYHIPVREVFASDEYVRGHSFMGYKVRKLAELEEQYGDFIILLAFAAHTDQLVEQIHQLAAHHPLYAPDVPLFGGGLFTPDYLKEHQDAFAQAYALMSDERSKKVYADIINFKLSGKIQYLSSCTSDPAVDMTELLKLGDQEEYFDLGAYDGDTILQLIEVCKGYKTITAFEPDPKNFRKLQATIQNHQLPNISCHNIGSYSHQTLLRFDNSGGRNSALSLGGKVEVPVDSVDRIAAGHPVSYIKMDVEGAEYETLLGATSTIQAYSPQLNIAAYHRNDDLFRLPLYLHSLNPNYKLHLRHHKYIPAWETILYASSR